jgi:hypothetical protein
MTEPAIEPDQDISPRRWLWWTIAFLSLALLVAVGAAAWSRQSSTTPPPAPTSVGGVPQPGAMPALPVTGVFIEPGDGRAPLLDEIRAARRSIDLAVYIVTDDLILQALEEAQSWS